MKVYTKIVIDLKTDEILKEESFEYSGEVVECKGGGDGYDKEYNRRMADIAERTAEMSEEAFDAWNLGADGEIGGLGSERGLSTARNIEAQKLLPAQTAFEEAGLGAGTQKLKYKSDLMNKFYESIGKTTEESAVGQARSDVAGAISKTKSTAIREQQRRGVTRPTGSIGLEGAKLEVGAISGARERARNRQIGEYERGLTI